MSECLVMDSHFAKLHYLTATKVCRYFLEARVMRLHMI